MSFFGKTRQTEAPGSYTSDPQSTRTDMVQQPAPPSPVGFETVLGANSTLEGRLSSGNNVRLDGTFTGTLEITGNVLVGETAKITADINARNISIAGAVRGNVTGKKVQLLRTGRIWGDIHAQALTTEEGAFIDGKITMISHDAAAQAQFDQTGSQPPAQGADRVMAALNSETHDHATETAEDAMVAEGGHDFSGGATEDDGPPPVQDDNPT